MTLNQWSAKFNIKPFLFRRTGMWYVHCDMIINREAFIALYDLIDYRVSSVNGIAVHMTER